MNYAELLKLASLALPKSVMAARLGMSLAEFSAKLQEDEEAQRVIAAAQAQSLVDITEGLYKIALMPWDKNYMAAAMHFHEQLSLELENAPIKLKRGQETPGQTNLVSMLPTDHIKRVEAARKQK